MDCEITLFSTRLCSKAELSKILYFPPMHGIYIFEEKNTYWSRLSKAVPTSPSCKYKRWFLFHQIGPSRPGRSQGLLYKHLRH